MPSRSKLSTSKVIIPTLSCSTIPSPSVVARFDVQTSLTARLPRKTRCTQQEGGRGDRRRLIKTATACVENDTDGVASARSMTHISTLESESPDCAIPTDSLEYYFFRSRGTRLSKGHAWPRDALGRGTRLAEGRAWPRAFGKMSLVLLKTANFRGTISRHAKNKTWPNQPAKSHAVDFGL